MTDTEEYAAPPTGSSEIQRGRSDEVAWMVLVSLVAFAGLALGVVSLALYISRDFGTATTGGGGGGGGGAPTNVIDVTATEFAFTPAVYDVGADQEVTVNFTNNGAIEHEWVVLESGVVISSESQYDEGTVLDRIPVTASGASATATFTFDAGTYQVICALPGHFDAGMKGELTAA